MRFATLFLILFSFPALANKTGLGVSIGNPTGLNGKYWLNGERAVDGGVAWSIGKNSNFSLHSDYLLHKKGSFYFNDSHLLDFYYGFGGRMEFSDEIELGLRVPFGLAHEFDSQSADIFGEIAPIVNLLPGTGLELHLLIGARYYF